MPFVGLADAAGIQDFVLHTPELKKIAAASQQIERMCLPGGLYYGTPAECLVAAGGNAVLRTDTRAALFEAFERISRALIEGGTGLQVVCCVEEYAAGDLPQACLRALRRLDQRKLTQARGTEFTFSGLSAPQPSPPPGVAVERPRKQNARRTYHQREYWEPQDFGDMICRSEERADLMAVVSVDGIGMGRKLNRWLAGWVEGFGPANAPAEPDALDAAFINDYRAWSGSLKERWRQAWEDAVASIVGAFQPDDAYAHPAQPDRRLWLRPGPGRRPFLPCRHIYQGGDDLSFVCDARLALALTARLLRALRDRPAAADVPAQFRSVPASAGVVFVDSHYPFARAVGLSERVRLSAKAAAQEADPDDPPAALSWWLNRAGALPPLEPLFEGASRKPYLLDGDEAWPTWQHLESTVLPRLWQMFGTARTKQKAVLAAAEANDRGASVARLLQQRPLRDAEGRAVTRPFSWEATEAASRSGFNASGQTVLIDAGELYDVHFPIASGESLAARDRQEDSRDIVRQGNS